MSDLAYYHDGIYYHNKFPRDWATSHREHTGPRNCEMCQLQGSINGLFIGYCSICVHSYPNYRRGGPYSNPSEFVVYMSDNEIWETFPYLIGESFLHSNFSFPELNFQHLDDIATTESITDDDTDYQNSNASITGNNADSDSDLDFEPRVLYKPQNNDETCIIQ